MARQFSLAAPGLMPPSRELVLPDGRTLVVPAWVETATAQAERRRIVGGRFFLVSLKGGQLGERLRCKRCSDRHQYLTRYCLELPFAGLKGSLWAYLHTMSGLLPSELDPIQRAKLTGLRMLFPGSPHAAEALDLAASHPQTARALRRSMTEPGRDGAHSDIDVGAVAVGLVERVEKPDAQQLLDRINTRAALYRYPKVAVDGLITS